MCLILKVYIHLAYIMAIQINKCYMCVIDMSKPLKII